MAIGSRTCSFVSYHTTLHTRKAHPLGVHVANQERHERWRAAQIQAEEEIKELKVVLPTHSPLPLASTMLYQNCDNLFNSLNLFNL